MKLALCVGHPNDQNRDQFDNENKDTTGQAGQSQPKGEQGKQPEFGQKQDDTTAQKGQPATGQSSTGQRESSRGDTALETRTDSETGQKSQTSETGQQGSSFVGSQGGTGSDEYLRNKENQETAQKSDNSESDIEGSSNKR